MLRIVSVQGISGEDMVQYVSGRGWCTEDRHFSNEDAVQNVSSMGLSNAAWGRFGFVLWRLRVP